MITVLTGTPGNGKTAHAVDLCFFDKTSMWYGLEKYVDGISGLKPLHFEFPDLKEIKADGYVPLSQVDDEKYAVWLPDNPFYLEYKTALASAKTSAELWFLWATPGSVIVIDESQRYFRPKPSGSAIPLYIQLLEYHRHFGVHFLLITQKENLLHNNVRLLAGQHIHLTDAWNGRHRFEWSEVKDSSSKTEKKLSAHHKYVLPKHVFDQYTSTVQVLKVKHKMPGFAKLAMVAALALPLIGYGAYKAWPSADKTKTASTGEVQRPSPADGLAVPGDASAATIESEIERFTPVVPGRPETAPAYQGMLRVSSVPVVSACIQSATRCRCYTQQGTRIHDITEEACRLRLENGPQFDPYESPRETPRQPMPSESPVRPFKVPAAGQVSNDVGSPVVLPYGGPDVSSRRDT